MHRLPTWQLFLCESKQSKSVPIPAEALLLFLRSSRDEVTTSTYIRSSSVRTEKRPSICKSNANSREALGMHTLSFMKLSKKRAHYFYRNDAPRWESTSTESLWFSFRYVVLLENQTNTWKTTRIYLARCAESIFFCLFLLFAFLQMSVRLYSCMHSKNTRLGGRKGKRMEHLTTQWRKEIGREIQCQQYANIR